jgi:hypothetical protein
VTKYLAYTVCLLILAMALPAQAGSGIIGMALSNTEMQVDQAKVSANANLSPGAVLASTNGPARIRLTNGARAVLSPHSAATVFADRLVLEKGTGTVSSPNYQLQSQGIQFATTSTGAQAEVTVQDSSVRVQALNGDVKVTRADGILLARVLPGTALDITPGATNSSVSTMSGVLRSQDGKLLLHDKLTNLDVELTGPALSSELGRQIEVTGTARPSQDRQSQVIQVARWNRLATDPEPTPDPTPDQGPKPPVIDAKPSSAISPGMSLGVKIALATAIGGAVAGAATYASMSR